MSSKIILKSSEKLKDLDLEEGELGMVGQQPYSLLNGSKTRVVGNGISFILKGKLTPSLANPGNMMLFYQMPVCFFDLVEGSESKLSADIQNANGDTLDVQWGAISISESGGFLFGVALKTFPTDDPYGYYVTYEGTYTPGKEEVVSE